MAFNLPRDDIGIDPWLTEESVERRLNHVNLAPLKGVIESDPMRSRILCLLIEDGGWVTTADLMRAARRVRPVVGAVTIGTVINGLNELVSSSFILSRTSLTSGLEWAEWRINPDWLEPMRKLLRMLRVPRPPVTVSSDGHPTGTRMLTDTSPPDLRRIE